jgi:hypothetical protein
MNEQVWLPATKLLEIYIYIYIVKYLTDTVLQLCSVEWLSELLNLILFLSLVRFGSVRFGSVRFGSVRFGSYILLLYHNFVTLIHLLLLYHHYFRKPPVHDHICVTLNLMKIIMLQCYNKCTVTTLYCSTCSVFFYGRNRSRARNKIINKSPNIIIDRSAAQRVLIFFTRTVNFIYFLDKNISTTTVRIHTHTHILLTFYANQC